MIERIKTGAIDVPKEADLPPQVTAEPRVDAKQLREDLVARGKQLDRMIRSGGNAGEIKDLEALKLSLTQTVSELDELLRGTELDGENI